MDGSINKFGGASSNRVRENKQIDALREKYLEHLRIAAAGDESLKAILDDPEKTNTLLGCIEDLSGSTQWIPSSFVEAQKTILEAQANMNERLRDAKAAFVKPLDGLADRVSNSADALKNAAELWSANSPAGKVNPLEGLSKMVGDQIDPDRLIRRRQTAMEIVDVLLKSVHQRSLEPNVAREEVASILTNSRVFNGTERDQILKTIPDIVRNDVGTPTSDVAKCIEKLKELMRVDASDIKYDTLVGKGKEMSAFPSIDQAIANVQIEQTKHLFKKTKNRDLWRESGTGDFMLRLSIERATSPTGEIDTTFIVQQLKRLGLEAEAKKAVDEYSKRIFVTGPDELKNRTQFFIDQLKPAFEGNNAISQLKQIFTDAKEKVQKENDRRAALTPPEAKLPWEEVTEYYVAELSKNGGEQVSLWWNWISSLPGTVTTDAELLKLLNQHKALADARSTLQDLRSLEEEGVSPTEFDSAVDSLRGVYAGLEKEKGENLIVNAGEVDKNNEHAGRILKLVQLAYTEMGSVPSFKQEKDPSARRRAIYIFLTKGKESATQYLTSKSTFYLSDDDFFKIAVMEERADDADISSGIDINTQMELNGILVHPAALSILSKTKGPDNCPLSIGETGIMNWLANPAAARPALEAILHDAEGKEYEGITEAMITAFTTGTDHGRMTNEKAVEYVTRIRTHLLRQAEDMQNNIDQTNAKEKRNFDPLNMLRAGTEAVKEMFVYGDPVQKALAAGLVFGGLYALYRMWKTKAGRGLIVGSMIFFGSDIALKRATGKGVLDRLNLNFMSKEDRNTSREQFIRSNTKESRYNFLDSDPGRRAMDVLMSPSKKVSAQSLLEWRQRVMKNGVMDYSTCAPEGLNYRAVMSAMGTADSVSLKSGERKRKAYEYLYLSFEALCNDVAERNELGGGDPDTKAALGADLIKHRYVDFDEPFLVASGFSDAMKQGCPPEGFTMLEILTYERPTAETNKAIIESTWPELIAAKMGVAKEWVIEKLELGYSQVQIWKMKVEAKAPDIYAYGKNAVFATYDTFKDWARVAWFKSSTEVSESFRGTYNYLKELSSQGWLEIKTNGPKALEWTFEAGVTAGRYGIQKCVDVYRELQRHAVTGPALDAFESVFLTLFGVLPKDKLAEELAKPSTFKETMKPIIARMSSREVTEEQLDQWLTASGVKAVEEEKKDAEGKVMKDATGKPIMVVTNAQECMLRQEALKRELFSYVAAVRTDYLFKNLGTPGFDPDQKVPVDWVIFNKETKTFDTNGDVQKLYGYIRTHYNEGQVLSLIGKGKTINGWLGDAAKSKNLGGKAATVLEFLTSFMNRADATEYYQHDTDAYLEPLLNEAKSRLSEGKITPAQHDSYVAYINTMLANALMESAFSTDQVDHGGAYLDINEAKGLLAHLRAFRGTSPAMSAKLLEELKNMKFKLDPDITNEDFFHRRMENPAMRARIAGYAPSAPREGALKKPGTAVSEDNRATADSKVTKEFLDKPYDETTKEDYLRAIRETSDSNQPALMNRIVQGVTKADDLNDLVVARTAVEHAETDDRLNAVIDKSVIKLLKSEANGSLNSDALAKMYKAVENNAQLQDAVSLGLEYTFLDPDGDYGSRTIGQYNSYLTTVLKLKPVSTEDTRGYFSWINFSGRDTTAAERFADKEKVSIQAAKNQILKEVGYID
ncbi:MAG: hypothetical protein ABL890_03740 [Candidatus Peribacteraceae bacterium]